jgi:hypothetical protein
MKNKIQQFMYSKNNTFYKLKFIISIFLTSLSLNAQSHTAKLVDVNCFKEFDIRNGVAEEKCSEIEFLQMVYEPITYQINDLFNVSTKFDYLNDNCNRVSRLKFWCLKENEWSVEVIFDFNKTLNSIVIQRISQVSCLPSEWNPVQVSLLRKFGVAKDIRKDRITFISRDDSESLVAHFESRYQHNERERGNASLYCPGGMRLSLVLSPERGLNNRMFNVFIKDLNERLASENKPKF